MVGVVGSTVTLRVDACGVTSAREFKRIPWYPGLTVLQAMIIGQAQNPAAFSFTVNYHSEYGAFVESIDDATEGGGKYWMLTIDGKDPQLGASEAIVVEQPVGTVAIVSWTLKIPGPSVASDQTRARIAATS